MQFLKASERQTIFDKVLATVDAKFMGPDIDIKGLRKRHEAAVRDAETSEAFESAMNGLLRDLGVSHTGFFHEACTAHSRTRGHRSHFHRERKPPTDSGGCSKTCTPAESLPTQAFGQAMCCSRSAVKT